MDLDKYIADKPELEDREYIAKLLALGGLTGIMMKVKEDNGTVTEVAINLENDEIIVKLDLMDDWKFRLKVIPEKISEGQPIPDNDEAI